MTLSNLPLTQCARQTLAMLCVGVALHANADSSRFAPGFNDEVVVTTGTRTAKALSESPVSVKVVTGVELEKVTVGTLDQALNFLPGVNFTRSQKDGYNIQMQGFDGDRVLVLVDGQRLVSPTGNSVDLAQISALNIKHIEIVRGASSVLYGSEAMGGVINIITKDTLRNSLEASAEFGVRPENTHDEVTEEYALLGTLKLGNWGVEASVQELASPAFAHDDAAFRDILSQHDRSFAKLGLRYHQGDFRGKYSFAFTDEDKEKLNSAAQNIRYISEVEQQQHSAQLHWRNLQIKSQYNQHEEFSGSTTKRTTDIDMLEFDVQYDFSLWRAQWVAGAHHYIDELTQENLSTGEFEIDDKTQDGVELYLQSDWLITNDFEMIVGGRAQSDKNYGSHSALRFNTMWNKDFSAARNLKWRAAIGESYRVPTLKEQYYVFDHSSLGYMVLGNPDLKAETAVSVNTGVEFTEKFNPHNALKVEFNLHHSDANDFISTRNDPELSAEMELDISRYENIDRAKIKGFDIDASYTHYRQKYQLSYNYLEARDSATHRRLADRPRHQLKANVNYPIAKSGFEILAYVVHKRDEAVPSNQSEISNAFTEFNVTLSHKFNEAFTWQLGVENLFDEHESFDLQQGSEFDIREPGGRYVFLRLKTHLH